MLGPSTGHIMLKVQKIIRMAENCSLFRYIDQVVEPFSVERCKFAIFALFKPFLPILPCRGTYYSKQPTYFVFFVVQISKCNFLGGVPKD